MGTKTFNITRAEQADLHGIKNLMLKALKEDPLAFSVTFEEYKDNSDSWWNSYLSPFFSNFYQTMILAKDENKISGMVGVIYDHKIRKKHIAAIVWFYVDPEYRKLGLGKKLMVTLTNDILKNSEIKKLSLLVNEPQKQAIKIYKKLGFSKSGKLKNELNFNGQFYDVLIMEKMVNGL